MSEMKINPLCDSKYCLTSPVNCLSEIKWTNVDFFSFQIGECVNNTQVKYCQASKQSTKGIEDKLTPTSPDLAITGRHMVIYKRMYLYPYLVLFLLKYRYSPPPRVFLKANLVHKIS